MSRGLGKAKGARGTIAALKNRSRMKDTVIFVGLVAFGVIVLCVALVVASHRDD
jgi:hypothetical protein